MKSISKTLLLVLLAVLFTRCSKSADPSAASTVTLKMSASTSSSTYVNGRVMSTIDGRASVDTTTGISITDVMVNVRDIKFEFDERDHHREDNQFKQDSSYSENDDAKLKGPFLVDLMNTGTFVDQVVTSVNLPNGLYERVRFKLSPSEASGDMMGKSIMITGKIDSIPFVFWHNRDAGFGAHFFSSDSTATDSTSISVTGQAVNLAINLEINKIFRVIDGGIDLTKAVDGNKDGVITIDPANDDGNKWIADQIMMRLIRHARCNRENKD